MEGVPSGVSLKEFAGPEGRFCPARVYEYPEDQVRRHLPPEACERAGGDNVSTTASPRPQDGKLVINAQNCLHCKSCSIKTPHEYIKWTVPEAGGGGPS